MECRSDETATFPGLLAGARTAAGLTQEELAERAQLSVRAVSNLERGLVARPRRDTVRRLCDALDLAGPAAERFAASARGRERAPVPVNPAQLPVDLADFTGRADALDRLRAALAVPGPGRPDGPQPVRTPVTVVEGGGGVGKTALAVHAAHRLRDRFPDGQLYLNLAGSRAQPVPAADALAGFLTVLGVDPGAVPEDEPARAALYRSLLADQRVLVLLDDAADTAQIRPLLPGGAGCAALVTSRRRLTDLEGAVHLTLDQLPVAEAVELFGAVAGRSRVAVEPAVVAEVAAACGYLPLAIRIVAARLAARPSWTVRALADRLADQRRRLDELRAGDLAVRASFQLSHDRLPAAQARLFALLGCWPGPDLSVPVVAALADLAPDAAEDLLERLVDVHLVETPLPGRYRLHDLLHAYARELAAGLGGPARVDALRRVLEFAAGTAYRAELTLRLSARPFLAGEETADPRALRFGSADEVMSWFGREWPGLLALLRELRNAEVPPIGPARLATLLTLYPFARGDWPGYELVSGLALEFATRAGDTRLAANAHHRLGSALDAQHRAQEAASHQEKALAGFREIGDREREAAILNAIGQRLGWRERRYPEALECLQEALRVSRRIGDRSLELMSLGNLGGVESFAGRHAEAVGYIRQALDLCRRIGDDRMAAFTLSNLGGALRELGELGEAVAHNVRAVEQLRELAEPKYEAMALVELARTRLAAGEPEPARAAAERALEIRRDSGDRAGAAEAGVELGRALAALDRQAAAVGQWRAALETFTELGSAAAEEVRGLLVRAGSVDAT